MELHFRTEVDKYGNAKLLDIDTEKKTFRCGYFYRYFTSNDIVILHKAMKSLKTQLLLSGFEEYDK